MNRALLAVAVAMLLAGGGVVLLCARPAPAPAQGGYSVARALGQDASLAGFERATAPRAFRFPDDHGPHPGYRTEWWYYTGNLRDGDGRRYGYQLTFFRVGLAPAPASGRSSFRADALWMAHFALTDVAGDRFLAQERFARGAAGLAGAQAVPYAVWLEGWRAETAGDGRTRLVARAGEVALDLVLAPAKPPVLQGEAGLSRKSAEHGNASYYYSMPRLATTGTLVVGGAPVGVTGTSWLDREWSTSALAPDQIGWDWFALQLDDGRELMLYRLRRRDGSSDPASAGMLVGVDGTGRALVATDARIAVLGEWTSPVSGVRYPSGWAIDLPSAGLRLRVTPVRRDQELRLTVHYWEGAVDVAGTAAGLPMGGVGYVELAGYGDAPAR